MPNTDCRAVFLAFLASKQTGTADWAHREPKRMLGTGSCGPSLYLMASGRLA